jgi:hypothetical protein
MKFIKKFERFINEEADPSVAPSKPGVKPGVKPSTKPSQPSRPSPIRRDKPSVSPDPKAKLKKATAEAVAEKFIKELNHRGDSVKNYIK